VEELAGLPPDYIARHEPDAEGGVTLTTDPHEMQPVMTFASNPELRRRMFLAYNTRAYPKNQQILLTCSHPSRSPPSSASAAGPIWLPPTR